MGAPSVFLTYNNETHSAAEWARLRGIPERTVNRRRQLPDWTLGQVLGFEPPPRKRGARQWKPQPDTGMPYCREHERAWYPGPTDAGWFTFPRHKITVILATAEAYNFTSAIRITPTPCDVCEQRRAASA